MKHNNVVPNVHAHKAWQTRVKTWFHQVRWPALRFLRARSLITDCC